MAKTSTDIDKSEFIKLYVLEMASAIKTMHPEWKKDDIKKVVMEMVEEKFHNPIVIMDNNYIHETRQATLLSIIDWWYDRKCILAGNGTFYKNQYEALNPTAKMLDTMATKRKSLKNQMFAYEESAPEYRALDLGQANEKINMNSYYGASGLPVSVFYSLWSGPATTLTAQSVISTTETAFEGFIGDNYLFTDMNEFIDWTVAVFEEKWEPDEWISEISEERLYNRFRQKFYKWKDKFDEPLAEFVHGLTAEQRTHLYYKNNIREFLVDHENVKEMYYEIYDKVENIEYVDKKGTPDDVPEELYERFKKDSPFSKPETFGKDYNKWVNTQRFLDPNKVPGTIKGTMNKLSDLFMKYCYVQFLVPDRIYRLKTFKRRVVVVVDTDSNMLNLAPWLRFVENNVLKGDTFGRDKEYNAFIGVNSMAFIITNMVTDLLLYYGKKSNIPEEYRPTFNMKNEFLFKKIIIAKKKKRYLSAIMLREGNLYSPLRIDEKGLDYIKSVTSESAMKFYRGLTVKYLLNTDKIDPKGLYDEIQKFRGDIKESLWNGEKTYLPNASAKEIDAYKDPWSTQSVRAVYAWNCVYPTQEIDLPSKVTIVKLNIFKPSDIDGLKDTYPDVYKALMNGIFNSPNPAIREKGCQVLALPGNCAKIPEWTRDYIDYTTMVSNIIAPFNCVMELVKFSGLSVGKSGKNGRKSTVYSNIIQF